MNAESPNYVPATRVRGMTLVESLVLVVVLTVSVWVAVSFLPGRQSLVDEVYPAIKGDFRSMADSAPLHYNQFGSYKNFVAVKPSHAGVEYTVTPVDHGMVVRAIYPPLEDLVCTLGIVRGKDSLDTSTDWVDYGSGVASSCQ